MIEEDTENQVVYYNHPETCIVHQKHGAVYLAVRSQDSELTLDASDVKHLSKKLAGWSGLAQDLKKVWVFARRGLRRQLTDCQLALRTALRREAVKDLEIQELEIQLKASKQEAHDLAMLAGDLAIKNLELRTKELESATIPALLEQNAEILEQNEEALAEAAKTFERNIALYFANLQLVTDDEKGLGKWIN